MLPLLTLSAFAAALTGSSPAPAPAARQDIVDLRAGRTPTRHHFVGWADDGSAVARSLVCSEGGELMCRAQLVRATPIGLDRTKLWSSHDYEDEQDPDAETLSLGRASAIRFIRAERDALAALPPLQPGQAVDTPTAAFGSIGGATTTVTVHARPTYDDMDSVRLSVAVTGPSGAVVRLRDLTETGRLERSRVLESRLSPDGERVWVAAYYEDGVMCWDGEDLVFAVANRAAVRARLANSVGLRAYRAGATAEARARFEDATREDATYVWGWFNRAALESHDGEVDAAEQSLRRAVAIDPTKEARACGDQDFANLRAAGRLTGCDAAG